MALGPLAASASSATPYTDPAVTGYLGLCNAAGNQVTHGSVDAEPFVVNSVSSVAAPASYRGKDSTATLYAFQPRTETPASAWSGEQLTGAARYTNAQHPESAATPADSSLANFLAGYPAIWNGFLELRMYLGAPGQPFDSTSYVATDIQVSGSSWHTVDGGTVDCHAGTAVSNETLLLPKSELRARPSAAPDTSTTRPGHGSASGSAAARSGNDGQSGTGSGTNASHPGSVNASSVADNQTSSNHSSAIDLVLVVAVLVVLLGGGYAFLRRRRT